MKDLEAIRAAVLALNHADDAHWTKDGKPSLNVLKESLGRKVTRAEVEEAAPDGVRVVEEPASEPDPSTPLVNDLRGLADRLDRYLHRNAPTHLKELRRAVGESLKRMGE